MYVQDDRVIFDYSEKRDLEAVTAMPLPASATVPAVLLWLTNGIAAVVDRGVFGATAIDILEDFVRRLPGGELALMPTRKTLN